MAATYKCAYCGSMQTWSGTGPRVCQSCGATQPETSGSKSPGSTTTEAGSAPRRGARLIGSMVVLLLVLFGALLFILRRSHHASSQDLPSVQLRSRILAVNNPPVRTLPAGSDLSAIDILHTASANAANLFDTSLLTVTKPRPMNDTDGNLWFVGEVTNRSPDRIAIAPAVQLLIQRGGHTLETRDLSLSDLPPRGHVPVSFEWGGEAAEVQQIVYRWKPVLSYPKTRANPTQLVISVENRTRTPGSVTVNFSYTYHFVTEKVQGTVTNHGDAIARNVEVYLTLYDAKNHVTGFKARSLKPIAPGEQVRYEIEAEQWGDPVKAVDVEALTTSDSKL
ncbi:FxLYD domain-containing protein [Terriglobus sp.]|uniref:FxLYD domain-containing protein n=1 Tax=Terriglobus sp. TaxID=1889013 RepID=UPI003AFFC4B1